MASNIQQAKLAGFAVRDPRISRAELLQFESCYQANRHRVYALAFWMTDNEISAEELMRSVFLRVFATGKQASTELVDRALVSELLGFHADFRLGQVDLVETYKDPADRAPLVEGLRMAGLSE